MVSQPLIETFKGDAFDVRVYVGHVRVMGGTFGTQELARYTGDRAERLVTSIERSIKRGFPHGSFVRPSQAIDYHAGRAIRNQD